MQPYVNPTRRNMDDNLNKFAMEDDLNFFEKGRRPQFLEMEDDLKKTNATKIT